MASSDIRSHIEVLRTGTPEEQRRAASALVPIAAGSTGETATLVGAGGVAALIRVVESDAEGAREQAAIVLGLLAGEGGALRDELRACPAFPRIVSELTRLLSGALAAQACAALSDVTDGDPAALAAVVASGVVPRLVALLTHSSTTVALAAVRIIGNLAQGDDAFTGAVLDAQPFAGLCLLLDHPDALTRELACWTISNLATGGEAAMQALLDAGIGSRVVALLGEHDAGLARLAAWTLENATEVATPAQVRALVSLGCVPALCARVGASDSSTACAALGAIGHILRADGALTLAVEAAGGLEQIEGAQRHPSPKVCEAALRLLTAYWETES